MSQPTDEEEDLIFSGKALAADGAVQPAKPIPLLHEVPAPDSLLTDPAYEPTVISTVPPQPAVAPASPGVELADRAPPPMASDYAPVKPDRPVRYRTPDVEWGKWLFRAAVLGTLVVGGWVLISGKLPLPAWPSLDALKTTESKEPKVEKRVGTPAPTLLVLSEPSGATVLIGGAEVCVTPWAGDNVWPREPLRVEVRKAGYRPWQGVTMGGTQATLEANLHRR